MKLANHRLKFAVNSAILTHFQGGRGSETPTPAQQQVGSNPELGEMDTRPSPSPGQHTATDTRPTTPCMATTRRYPGSPREGTGFQGMGVAKNPDILQQPLQADGVLGGMNPTFYTTSQQASDIVFQSFRLFEYIQFSSTSKSISPMPTIWN